MAGFGLYEACFFTAGIVVGFASGSLLYFILHVPLNIATFISVFVVAPFGWLGMWNFHEMRGPQFLKAAYRTFISEPRVMTYGSKNEYYEEYKNQLKNRKGVRGFGFIRNIKKSSDRKKSREKK